MNVPVAVGVPLIVIKLDDQLADRPKGKPVAVPIPVAPVVAIVIFVAVFTISVGFVNDDHVFRLHGVTVVVVVIGGETPTAFLATTEKL